MSSLPEVRATAEARGRLKRASIPGLGASTGCTASPNPRFLDSLALIGGAGTT
jgi:hypothetical protein